MDTARTDAVAIYAGDIGDEVVRADFARTLERELAQANARIAELTDKDLCKMGQSPCQYALTLIARAESAERELATLRQVKAGQQAEPVVLGGGSGPFPVRVIGSAPDGWVLVREQYEIFRADYIRYQSGDPKMPFSELRESMIAFINEMDTALAAAPAAPSSEWSSGFTDQHEKQFAALLLAWELGECRMYCDDQGRFCIDVDHAEGLDHTFKGNTPDEAMDAAFAGLCPDPERFSRAAAKAAPAAPESK